MATFMSVESSSTSPTPINSADTSSALNSIVNQNDTVGACHVLEYQTLNPPVSGRHHLSSKIFHSVFDPWRTQSPSPMTR